MIRKLQEFLPRELRDALRQASLTRKNVARGEVFYCAALEGESDYNICINADLTVSCNCQDFDGSGHIGDLNHQSFGEIFSGSTVTRFRATLAANQLPTRTCLHCSELKAGPAQEVQARLSTPRVPGRGIMLENTALCNLKCAMCDRDGLRKLRGGKVRLPPGDVERVAILLRQYKVENLSFFNLGEPFLPDDVLDQVETIRRYNPDLAITTSTNGQLLDQPGRLDAALLMDYIYVSLDGVSNAVVNRYQVGASFDRAYRNMAALVAERDRRGKRAPLVEWKYVLFRWNDSPRQIEEALELAREAKVDRIGFYRGDGPLWHRSLRWYTSGIRSLGSSVSCGVVVDLSLERGNSS